MSLLGITYVKVHLHQDSGLLLVERQNIFILPNKTKLVFSLAFTTLSFALDSDTGIEYAWSINKLTNVDLIIDNESSGL